MAKSAISLLKSKSLVSTKAIALAIFFAPTFAIGQSAAPVEETQVETEVIVTATKRNERLSDVPIAISVFNAAEIDQTGVRELSQLTGYIPNVQVSGHNDFRAAIMIRGVGSNSRNIGFDSRVGVYVDGVYMGQSPSVNQELLDLARVEVLRGPQGMLFGKNTVAGAISLVTTKPTDEFSAELSATFGNYNHSEIRGMINLPLGEKAAVKLSAAKTNTDGYILNTVTNNMLDSKDVFAYRAQLRITPSDRFEINFAFDALTADNKILVGEPSTDYLGIAPITIAPQPRVVAFAMDPRENRDIYGATLNLEYKMANDFILRSITGYRDTDAAYTNETDYSPIPIISIAYNDIFKQTTQEFQVISPRISKLTYMGGLYFYAQTAQTSRDVILGSSFHEGFIAPAVAPSVAPLLGLDKNNLSAADLALISAVVGFGPEGSKVFNNGTVDTESFAAYVNGGYDFSEQWKIGFGARYSTETKSVNWLLDGRNSGVFGIGSTNRDSAGVPRPMINERTDEYLSPALSLSYKTTGGTNIYAKYSTGYKSGGFNLDYINANELAANAGLEFDKETVRSTEIGLKGKYFDRRLTLNLAAFTADYDDYQVNQFVDLGGGRTSIRITNAAKVKTKGIEAEFNFKATDNFTLQGSIGVLDAKFDKFLGGGTAGSDASGKRLTNAPELTATLSGIFTADVSSLNSMLLARADVTYSGDQFTTADNVRTLTLPSRAVVPYGYIGEQTKLNGRIGLISKNAKWEAFIWGQNLTDEKGDLDGFRDFFGTIVNHPQRGKTYGIELVTKF